MKENVAQNAETSFMNWSIPRSMRDVQMPGWLLTFGVIVGMSTEDHQLNMVTENKLSFVQGYIFHEERRDWACWQNLRTFVMGGGNSW